MRFKGIDGYEFTPIGDGKSPAYTAHQGCSNVGSITKLRPKQWRAWPAKDGRPGPKAIVSVHESLRRAAAHIAKTHVELTRES